MQNNQLSKLVPMSLRFQIQGVKMLLGVVDTYNCAVIVTVDPTNDKPAVC